MKPKPAMHLAGERDQLVKYQWQQQLMQAVHKLNDCEPQGSEWARHSTLYDSKSGTPFVAFVHSGGHAFPREAPPLIVRFFKENPA